MRVKMITKMAGPDGCHAPGDVVDFSASTASALIGGGYAVQVDELPSRIEKAVIEPEETRGAGDAGLEVNTASARNMKRRR